MIESVRVLKKKTTIFHFTSTEIDNNQTNPYSLSKYLSEEIQKLYTKLYNINIHIMKLNNIFGPGDMSSLRLIPSICKNFCKNKKFNLNAKKKNDPLKFTYVSDLIDFIEDKIKKYQSKTTYKKIKYYKSTPKNIYKLLYKLNKKNVLGCNHLKITRNEFENKLFSTLKWYRKNL